MAFVDEVWTYSEFERRAVEAAVDRPVRVLNPAIPLDRVRPRPRAALGLPDGFVFLYSFDYLSVFERKNPLAAIAAFTRAFSPGDGATLVVKGVNADSAPASRDALLAAAHGRPDIRVWHDYLDAGNQRSLIASCDVYVSLHRSEGFGLTMAEAMAAGTPVIATAYSGNLDFMDETNSFLAPYRLAPVSDPRSIRIQKVPGGLSRTSARLLRSCAASSRIRLRSSAAPRRRDAI